MNFLEFIYPKTGNHIRVGDLVNFNRYAGERKTLSWIALITEIKAHKLKIFIPAENAYDWIRNNVINGLSPSANDMEVNSKASQILRFASTKVKELSEQYNKKRVLIW